MALTTSEVERIKYELGYNVLTVGAEPYIGVTQLFDIVIKPYTQAGASTTSSTTVEAANPAAVVAVTLASATGISAGDRVVIDVDGAQEIATVRSLSGSVASLYLSLAHAGTYPVTVEGGESIVRGILTELRKYSEPLGLISQIADVAGIIQVDEVKFSDRFDTSRSYEMRRAQASLRDELADALGCENRRRMNGGSGAVVY